MKIISSFLLVLITTFNLCAQVPAKMSYQSVMRNSKGELLTNQQIGIRISILKGENIQNEVFSETHSVSTNNNGLISLVIGQGQNQDGELKTIDWSDGEYYVLTETDPNGGTNYIISGSSKLLSVPYAFYAENASNIQNSGGFATQKALEDTANAIREDIPIIQDYIKIEVDPVYSASIASGITSDDTANWNNKLDRFNETDPVFGTSVAKSITSHDTASWNNKLEVEEDSDPTNELQAISISNDTIYLENGGFVKLPTNTSIGPTFITEVSYFLSSTGPPFEIDLTGIVPDGSKAVIAVVEFVNKVHVDYYGGTYLEAIFGDGDDKIRIENPIVTTSHSNYYSQTGTIRTQIILPIRDDNTLLLNFLGASFLYINGYF